MLAAGTEITGLRLLSSS